MRDANTKSIILAAALEVMQHRCANAAVRLGAFEGQAEETQRRLYQDRARVAAVTLTATVTGPDTPAATEEAGEVYDALLASYAKGFEAQRPQAVGLSPSGRLG